MFKVKKEYINTKKVESVNEARKDLYSRLIKQYDEAEYMEKRSKELGIDRAVSQFTAVKEMTLRQLKEL